MPLITTKKSVMVARLIYLTFSILMGVIFAYLLDDGKGKYAWLGLILGVSVGSFFIYVESLSKQFSIRGFSTATFGLCIGLFCAWLLQTVRVPEIFVQALALHKLPVNGEAMDVGVIILGFNFILFSSLGYLGTVLALRTNQDDFSIVIPFIRFQQQDIKGRPIVCSTDILIDGRLPKLIQSTFINSHIILPPFVMDQLQLLANAPSSIKSSQGQRGLATLNLLRNDSTVSITSHKFDTSKKGDSHDTQTILTCRQLDCRLLTCDENLSQLAKIQDIKVLDLKDLTEAMRHEVYVGQRLQLTLTKPGKEDHQTIGFLPDGTMIVVNNSDHLLGSSQYVTVISTLPTSAGVMVFSELDEAS